MAKKKTLDENAMAAKMRARLKQRLIGLLLFGIVVLLVSPMILDEPTTYLAVISTPTPYTPVLKPPEPLFEGLLAERDRIVGQVNAERLAYAQVLAAPLPGNAETEPGDAEAEAVPVPENGAENVLDAKKELKAEVTESEVTESEGVALEVTPEKPEEREQSIMQEKKTQKEVTGVSLDFLTKRIGKALGIEEASTEAKYSAVSEIAPRGNPFALGRAWVLRLKTAARAEALATLQGQLQEAGIRAFVRRQSGEASLPLPLEASRVPEVSVEQVEVSKAVFELLVGPELRREAAERVRERLRTAFPEYTPELIPYRPE